MPSERARTRPFWLLFYQEGQQGTGAQSWRAAGGSNVSAIRFTTAAWAHYRVCALPALTAIRAAYGERAPDMVASGVRSTHPSALKWT
jgi:hypothetical protein